MKSRNKKTTSKTSRRSAPKRISQPKVILPQESLRDRITKLWATEKGDAQAIAEGCYFEPSAGFHVVAFFHRYLRHSTGHWDGLPFILQPWQRRMLYRLFGWKRADGSRRFRIAYVEVPKKNGKSTLASGIALYMCSADGEASAEVYTAAADKDQASITYRECAKMVNASPQLKERLEVVDSRKTIAYTRKSSFIRALSADAFTKEGLNIHALIFDELHAQKTRELWDALRYAGAARRQPLIFAITTAGYDKNSICYEQHDYAKKILEGIITDSSFFACIYAADEEDDWKSESTWHKANPSLGVTINLQDYRSDFKEATNSPSKENSFKRYRLCLWTEQDVRWMQIEKWDSCHKPGLSLQELHGARSVGGLDLASTTDIAAFALWFPDHKSLLTYFFCPKESVSQRTLKARLPYELWVKQGYIIETEGNVVDYDKIRVFINELSEVVDIEAIAIDRWNSTQLQTQLMGDGFEVVPFGQGFSSMSAPTKDFEKRVVSGDLFHDNNPVMRWMISNVSVEEDAAGNLKPSRKKSSEKIDGVVAGIMALGHAMTLPAISSIYKTRGIRTL